MKRAPIRPSEYNAREVRRASMETQRELKALQRALPGTVKSGEATLDGANPTPVTTGLTTALTFVAIPKRSTAPTTNTAFLTATLSGGTASVYAWQQDGSASTGTENFYWQATGD